jgi:hypothetical protein
MMLKLALTIQQQIAGRLMNDKIEMNLKASGKNMCWPR